MYASYYTIICYQTWSNDWRFWVHSVKRELPLASPRRARCGAAAEEWEGGWCGKMLGTARHCRISCGHIRYIYIYTIDICVLIFIAWHNITRYQQISPVSWANPNSIFGDIPTKLGSLCPDGYYPLLPGQSWTAHLRIAKTRVFHYWNTVLIPWWLELLLKFWSLDWYESCMGFIDAWEPAMNPKTHKTLCIEMTTWK